MNATGCSRGRRGRRTRPRPGEPDGCPRPCRRTVPSVIWPPGGGDGVRPLRGDEHLVDGRGCWRGAVLGEIPPGRLRRGSSRRGLGIRPGVSVPDGSASSISTRPVVGRRQQGEGVPVEQCLSDRSHVGFRIVCLGGQVLAAAVAFPGSGGRCRVGGRGGPCGPGVGAGDEAVDADGGEATMTMPVAVRVMMPPLRRCCRCEDDDMGGLSAEGCSVAWRVRFPPAPCLSARNLCAVA